MDRPLSAIEVNGPYRNDECNNVQIALFKLSLRAPLIGKSELSFSDVGGEGAIGMAHFVHQNWNSGTKYARKVTLPNRVHLIQK